MFSAWPFERLMGIRCPLLCGREVLHLHSHDRAVMMRLQLACPCDAATKSAAKSGCMHDSQMFAHAVLWLRSSEWR